MLQMESVWRSPICPHRRYAFVALPHTRPRLRVGPFFQVILGLNKTRVKQLLGELAKPIDNGLTEDIIQFYAGTREPQRAHWIQSQAAWPSRTIFTVFEHLIYLKLVYQYRYEIPQPFEGDDAMDFTDKVYREYDEIRQMMVIPWLGEYRRYLMNHWYDFRIIGIELIHRGITLQDIMKIYNQQHKLYRHEYISRIVRLWL